MRLSVVIPFLNEHATLRALVEQVLAVALPSEWDKELLLVDDGSSDGSQLEADRLAAQHPEQIRVIHFPENGGKGRAVIAGLQAATGDVCIIQDADLEYDPNDYGPILRKFDDPSVKVVYGSRVLGSQNRFSWTYYWGGRGLSWITNLLFRSRITDEPTCYKAFRREVLQTITLRSRGFEICPELTGKLLRAGYRIEEVPIHYRPRSFREGKKIRARDGWKAVVTLLRIRFGWD